jgi:purine-binding chemotaxis protein CheW
MTDVLHLVIFRVGHDLLALDLMRVREVSRPLPLTPVRHAPLGMLGVIDLRDEILPLIDVRTRFGLPARDKAVEPRHLVIRLDGRSCALQIDEVVEVTTVSITSVRAVDAMLQGRAPSCFVGVCPRPEGLVLLLDVRRFLGSDLDNVDGVHGSPGGPAL